MLLSRWSYVTVISLSAFIKSFNCNRVRHVREACPVLPGIGTVLGIISVTADYYDLLIQLWIRKSEGEIVKQSNISITTS